MSIQSSKFILINNNVLGIDILKKSIKVEYLLYNNFNNKSEIDLFFIENNLTNLTHFAFLYDNNNIYIPFFSFDNKYFGELFSYFISKIVSLNNSIIIDIITCDINRPEHIESITVLEALYNINIRYSLNKTGDYQYGGDWIMESDNINIKDDYFNENINDWNYILYTSFNTNDDGLLIDISGKQWFTDIDLSGNPLNPIYDASGYNIRYPSGKTVCWGYGVTNNVFSTDISFSTVSSRLQSGVVAVVSNNSAYAAIKADNSVITWGSSTSGGNSSSVSSQLQSNVRAIYMTSTAFIALKIDGGLVTWGSATTGGNSSSVSAQIQNNISRVYTNDSAVAVIKTNGGIVVWGSSTQGGDLSGVSSRLQSNVKTIYAMPGAFAALKTDGSVVTWGSTNSSTVSSQLQSNVRVIFSNNNSFVALKQDGSIVTWGTIGTNYKPNELTNVVRVCPTFLGWGAIKANGSLTFWGNPFDYSYNISASDISSGNYVMYGNSDSNVVLKQNGTMYGWGIVSNTPTSTTSRVYIGSSSFAIVSSTGGVTTWGVRTTANLPTTTQQAQINSNVSRLIGNSSAFSAIKKDNSIVLWGSANYGGNAGSVSSELRRNVQQVFPSNLGMMALIYKSLPSGTLTISGNLTISGLLIYGQQLTAINTLSDPYGMNSVMYTWQIADSSGGPYTTVSSLASNTFMTVQAFIYKYIQVYVSYIDNNNDTSQLIYSNRLGPISFTYPSTFEWQVADSSNSIFTAISGATIYNYIFTQDQVGKYVRLKTYYIDISGDPAFAISNIMGPVSNVDDNPTGGITINGTAQYLSRLSINSTISDIDGISGSLTYQWQKSTTNTFASIINLTVSSSYLIPNTGADNNAYIRVLVSYTDNYGIQTTVTSNTIGPILDSTHYYTGGATIVGTATQNQTLTITNTIADIDGISAGFKFQWQQSITSTGTYNNISGATLSSFILTQNQVGNYIKVIVSYVDNLGQDYSILSGNNIGPIANINDAPIGSITISGVTQRGMTLSYASTVSDIDGISGLITYTWYQADTSGGTYTSLGVSATLLLLSTQINKFIKIRANYTDNYNTNQVVDSTIYQIANFYSLTYQWQQSDTGTSDTMTDISGATISAYLFTQAQVGKFVRLKIYYIDINNDPGYAYSNIMGPIANVNDPPTGIVTISGTAQQGVVLTITRSISDIDGISGTMAYQWQQSTTSGGIYSNISSAVLSNYTISGSDVNKFIRVLVSYTDNYGTLTTVSSIAIGPVLDSTHAPIGSVVITGSATQNTVLSISNTISDIDGISGPFSYQWTQSATSNGIYTNISGATLSNFLLTQVQVQQYIQVIVSYLDKLGQYYYIPSTSFGPIANVNDLPTGVSVINGPIQRGMTVTAANTISDLDGISGPITYTWWQSDTSGGVAMNISVSSSLALTNTNANKYIQLIATYLDNYGAAETVCSIISQVANFYSSTYEWQVCDTSNGTFITISDATVSNYIFTPAQVGKFVRVKIYYVDNNGDPGYAFSNIMGPIIAFAPRTYQWQQSDTSNGTFTNIIGGTISNYILTQEQVNKYIKVNVSYTAPSGDIVSVDSNIIGPVINVQDMYTGTVLITGTPTQNILLTVSNTISDIDGISGGFIYQWYQGTASGTINTIISTSSAVTLSQSQVRQYVQVIVSYTDNFGMSSTICSNIIGPVANVNDQPSGSITISGSVTQYQTLTIINTICDLDGISGLFTYQWYQGTTSSTINTLVSSISTLILTQAHVSRYIQVNVTYTDNFGTLTTVCSNIVGPVANINESPSGIIVISGTPTQYQTLSITNTICDLDGISGPLAYQWYRGSTSGTVTIPLGTISTQVLSQTEVKQYIQVVVIYTDNFGMANTVCSNIVGPVANVNESPSGLITISGIATQYQTLSIVNTICDLDGISGLFTYQWYQGTTSSTINTLVSSISTLILTQSQVKQYIRVNVIYTDNFGMLTTVCSNVVGPVANIDESPSGTITISGLTIQYQTLTIINTICDLDGISGPLAYKWYQGTTSSTINILVSSISTLILTQSQVSNYIQVNITYTDNFGQANTVCSNIVGPVANINESPSGTIVISGTPTQYQTLSITNTICDLDGISGPLAYQWYRGSTSGTITIPLGTVSNQVLSQAEVKQYIQVVITYTDNFGMANTVCSNIVGPVANINESPSGTIVISGTLTQYQTLAITNTICDLDGISGPFTYQWYQGTTSSTINTLVSSISTLILTQTQVKQYIRVNVIYTDNFGITNTVCSNIVGPVANIDDSPSGTIVISGTPTQYQTLSITNTICDLDGISGPLAYQWYRGSTSGTITIPLGTVSNQVLSQAEVNQYIQVNITYTDNFGAFNTVCSNIIGPVANINDSPINNLYISGIIALDYTLNVYGTLSDIDGISGPINLQWQESDTSNGTYSNISGSVQNDFYLTQNQIGKFIRVRVSYTDNQGTSETVVSNYIGPIIYNSSSPLAPNNSSYDVLVNNTIQTYISKPTVNDISNNTFGITNDTSIITTFSNRTSNYTIGNPLLVMKTKYNLSDISNFTSSLINAFTNNVNNIIIERQIDNTTTNTSATYIQKTDGLFTINDISNNVKLSINVSNASDLAILSITPTKTTDLNNKILGRFYFKLIDLSTNTIKNTGFNIPIQFQLSYINILNPIDTLDVNRYNITTNTWDLIGNAQRTFGNNFNFDFTTNSDYQLLQSVPDKPTNVIAYQTNSYIYVSFNPPNYTGTSAINGYKVVVSPGGYEKTELNTIIRIPNLTIGTAYTFVVYAINSSGVSYASDSSNTLTPIINLTISGILIESNTLYSVASISDLDGISGGINLQWQQSDTSNNFTNISGAVLSSLLLIDTNINKYIRVLVSYTDNYSTIYTVSSNILGPIIANASASISGLFLQNQTLIANINASNISGLLSYQWYQRDSISSSWISIIGETLSSFILTQSQVDKYIKVIISYLTTTNTTNIVSSNIVGPIINVNDLPSNIITISGLLKQNNTIYITNTISDIDGISGPLSYQWLYCKDLSGTYTNISGATISSLLLDRTHINRYIKVLVNYTDNYGTAEYVISNAIGPILDDTNMCILSDIGLSGKIGNFINMNTNYAFTDISYNWYSYSDISKNNPVLIKSKQKLFLIIEYTNKYIECRVTYNYDYEALIKTSNLLYIPSLYNVEDFDYILTLNIGSSQINSLFNTSSYSIITNDYSNVDISFNFNNDNLYNYFTAPKTNIVYGNPGVNMAGFQKTKSSFGNRLLEVMAMKIFGHPMAKAAIGNALEFRDISGIIMKTQTSLDSSKLAVFNYYLGLDKVDNPQLNIPYTFDFTNAEITFPLYMTGHVSRLFDEPYVLKNGPQVGGALVVNGMYNVPLLFKIK